MHHNFPGIAGSSGAKEYADDNRAKGILYSRRSAALLRHFRIVVRGEDAGSERRPLSSVQLMCDAAIPFCRGRDRKDLDEGFLVREEVPGQAHGIGGTIRSEEVDSSESNPSAGQPGEVDRPGYGPIRRSAN